MKREYGDAILLGASSLKHIEQVGTLLEYQVVLWSILTPLLSEPDRPREGSLA